LPLIESLENTPQAGNLVDHFARFQYGAAKLVIKNFDLVIKACDREMSALGQKATFAMQTGMSALPQKAHVSGGGLEGP